MDRLRAWAWRAELEGSETPGVSLWEIHVWSNSMSVYLKHGLLLSTALMILASTLCIFSNPVQNKEMLPLASFGYPYEFLSQDLSLMDGFLFFPGHYKFSFDFEKYPLSGFSFSHFLADFLIILGIIEVIVFILEKCKEFFVNRKIWPYSGPNWLYATLFFATSVSSWGACLPLAWFPQCRRAFAGGWCPLFDIMT